MHRKLKEIAGIFETKPPAILVYRNNRPIIEKEQKQAVWKDYVTKDLTNLQHMNLQGIGPLISKTGSRFYYSWKE